MFVLVESGSMEENIKIGIIGGTHGTKKKGINYMNIFTVKDVFKMMLCVILGALLGVLLR